MNERQSKAALHLARTVEIFSNTPFGPDGTAFNNALDDMFTALEELKAELNEDNIEEALSYYELLPA